MKHIVTLIQICFWLVMDTILLIYYLKWNKYLTKHGYFFKKNKYGIVTYANNAERRSYVENNANKYYAAIFFK